MNYLTSNKNLIRKKSVLLYNQIFVYSAIHDDIRLNKDEENNYYIKKTSNNVFVHSCYSIERENQKMLDVVNLDTEMIIFYGIGLGHCLGYAKNKFKNLKKIVIIEPNQEVFRKFLEIYDIDKLLEGFEEITFIINQETENVISQLNNILCKSINTKFEIVYLMAYKSIYSKYFNKINNAGIENIRENIINVATIERYRYVWLSNSFKNLRINSISENCISSILKNRTVFLVSAGPSLNKNIHLIKEIGEKGIVVAVGSAIKILDTYGIKPHFRVAIDASPGQKKIFNDLEIKDIPLISPYMHSFEVQKMYKGKIIRLIQDTDFLIHYIYGKAKISYKMNNTGYSVANLALNFLCNNNVKKVIFLGQDFSFSEGKQYADGSWTNDDIKDFDSKRYIKILDIYGKEVYTDKQHYSMKLLMERTISQYKDSIIFIDATEGGAKIENTIIKPLNKVLKEDLDIDIETSSIEEQLNKCQCETQEDIFDEVIRLMRTDNDDFLEKINYIINKIEYYQNEESGSIAYNEVFKITNSVYFNELVKKYLLIEDFKFSNLNNKKQNNGKIEREKLKEYSELFKQYQKFGLVIDNLIKEYFNEGSFDIIIEN